MIISSAEQPLQKSCKIGYGHMVTYLTTGITYDLNFGLNEPVQVGTSGRTETYSLKIKIEVFEVFVKWDNRNQQKTSTGK